MSIKECRIRVPLSYPYPLYPKFAYSKNYPMWILRTSLHSFLLSFTTCRLSFVEFMTCCQWNATQSALFCHCWHHTQIQILAQLQIQGQGQIRPRQRSWQLSDVVALLHIFSSHFQFHLCHNLKCKTQARMSGLWDGTLGDFDKCRCHLA